MSILFLAGLLNLDWFGSDVHVNNIANVGEIIR